MRLVEQHKVKMNKSGKDCIWFEWCGKAKLFYNQCLYYWRQSMFKNIQYFTEYELVNLLTEFNDSKFRSLPANTSQQIIKVMFKNIKSWIKSRADYAKHPEKYTGRPKMPYYKDKLSELHFTTNQVKLKDGYVHFPKMIGAKPIKTSIPNLKHCRVIPKDNYFIIEFIYDVEDKPFKPNNGKLIGIDLGVNNLVTVVSTLGDSFIISGKKAKSINQFYNKCRAEKQSKLPKDVYTSKRLTALTNKHNQQIKDFLHKVSRYIVNYCLDNDITSIVIGLNKQWKTESSMSKCTNQNFISIPHTQLINLIEYKARLEGIRVVTTEESYTSKCSALDLETLEYHEKYKGKRVKRGLFKTSKGKLINADANGALNILRKVSGDVVITDSLERCVVQPYIVKSKHLL